MKTIKTRKDRIQVSISAILVIQSQKLMKLRGFDSFSELLESLIRDESERRGLTAAAKETRGEPGRAELNENAPIYGKRGPTP